MSIKINNENIVALYKGEQSIAYVYKGTDLVWRLVELGMDDDIFFVDPEVGRVLYSNGLIANPVKSSRRELATIKTLNPGGNTGSYFYGNKVITKFPELKYCTGLTELINAFSNCSNLTEVTIPDSVTDMSSTFSRCYSLVNAPTIPEGVTDMYATFYMCSSLVNAPILPEGIRGHNNLWFTFLGCSSLVNAPNIPDSVTSMYATFSNCSNLINAPTIPEGVTNMQDTFRECYSLVNPPIIPEGVTKMTMTFTDCYSIDNIFIIKPVKPPSCFYTLRDINIVAIYVPDESVDAYKSADEWSDHADKIYPMSDNDIIFADPEVGRVLHANGLIADPIKSSKIELATIKSLNPSGTWDGSYFYGNKVITKFPELQYCTGLTDTYGTFRDCSNLTEVTIPDSVTDMTYTFSGCSNLINAPIIPISVTSMYATFRHCINLTEAPTIPVSVTDMTYTFSGCSNLINAPTIPEGVTNMTQTFYECSNLDGIFIIKRVNPPTYYYTFSNIVAIYVPDNSVGTYKSRTGWSDHSSMIYPQDDIYFADPEVGRVLHANGLIADPIKSSKIELSQITTLNPSGKYDTGYFYNNKVITKFPELQYCTGLSSLTYTFNRCSNLTEVTIPDSVTDMTSTFRECRSLVDAPTIPNSVTSMSSTFNYCTSLINATIPNSVTSMSSTFTYCASLINAPTIPEGVTNMSETFYNCINLIEAPIIPNSVTNMTGTFRHCVNLINATTIPISVTELIGTFRGCNRLRKAPIIHEGVTNMDHTFFDCYGTDGIFIIKPVNPPTNYYTFSTNIVAIYVPDASVSAYKSASWWSGDADKIKPISELPE